MDSIQASHASVNKHHLAFSMPFNIDIKQRELVVKWISIPSKITELFPVSVFLYIIQKVGMLKNDAFNYWAPRYSQAYYFFAWPSIF